MPNSIFRLINRARSRSQRRQLYVWVVCFFFGLFVFVYSMPQSFLTQHVSVEEELRHLPQVPVVDPRQKRHNKGVERLLNRNNDADITDNEDDEHGDLLPDLAPPTVHFMWCGRWRYFEFQHYLSIKRTNQIVKPDKIFFHYQSLPIEDSERYYSWFNLTLSEIDHILLRPLNSTRCETSGPNRYIQVLELLEAFGGIYMPEDALLVDFPVHLRHSEFASGVVAKTMRTYLDGIVVSKKNGFKVPTSQIELNILLDSGRSAAQGSLNPCGSVDHYNREEEGECICVKVHREIFPRDIWNIQSNFGTLARLAGYERPSITAKSSARVLIPKIGHYICWDCELKFDTYLSVISALHVAGLSKVYIHGPKRPSGAWWTRLEETKRVTHIFREYPEHSHDRATMTQQLAQGLMRVSILLKYGGVYCDSRVIWTQPIPDEHFTYDAVASPDWHGYGAWPDSMSHTSIMAKANSEYLHKLRIQHYQNHKQKFWFVDQFLGYKILEQHPHLVYLDRRFQVKCRNHNCHPTWVAGYKAPISENPPGAPFSWFSDTLSVFWDVFPSLEMDTVKYTSGPIVDAARRALHRSGISVQELK